MDVRFPVWHILAIPNLYSTGKAHIEEGITTK